MEIEHSLVKLGLNTKEIKVYLSLLAMGAVTIESVSRRAGVPRSTTYLVLSTLGEKGLVSIVPQKKKNLYKAETPEKILSSLNKKTELAKRVVPELLALYATQNENPLVQYFKGKEGVREVYALFFGVLEAKFFGTTREIMKLDPEGTRQFMKKARLHKLKIKDLMSCTAEDIEYAQEMSTSDSYEVRFSQPGLDFPSDSGVFGDRVVFFSFHPTPFAVVITSPDIARNMNSLYDLAWQSSLTLDQVRSQY